MHFCHTLLQTVEQSQYCSSDLPLIMKVAFNNCLVIVGTTVLLACFFMPSERLYFDVLLQAQVYGAMVAEKPIRVIVISLNTYTTYMYTLYTLLDKKKHIFLSSMHLVNIFAFFALLKTCF